jgi:putative glutamine amidotransferase
VGDAWGYTLGVQWHPEWKVEENPASKAIFRSFGESCKARSMQR